MPRVRELSPYVELHREQWRELRSSTPLPLTADELLRLRGLGEQVDLVEVAEVYLPLSRLINLQVAARQRLYKATTTFLGEECLATKVPYVIGSPGASRSASRPPPASCAPCWPAGRTTPGWTW